MAAETGWPLDKVTRYAEPPLGERAYVAEQARAVEISRSRGGSTLEESVSTRLSVDPADVAWDAYRTEDARWFVTAAHGGRIVGTWTFDTVGRTVHPQDESARALMGGGPSSVAEASGSAPESAVEPTHEPTQEAAPEATPARPRLVSVTSDPAAEHGTNTDLGQPDVATPATPGTPEAGGEQEALLEQSDVSSAPRRAKRAKGKKGRASVPSWDEILFGASRPED